MIWFTYDYMGYLMYYIAFILWFNHYLDSRTEICQIFRWLFGKLKKNQKDILKLTDLYLKRKFQHTGRSRRYRNNLILQFQSELWIIYFPNLCKNVKIIRQKDNLELGWEAEIKLLQPKPVKSDFFFLNTAR